MSVTTSSNGTRLTRSQSNQMPALLEFYSPSAALLDVRAKGPARAVIWTVAGLFASCAIAAGLVPIDKVVTAPGKVTAAESTIVVQPLETAIVRQIAVQEGQVVHKGDLLARLDPTFTTSDKTALSQSVQSLTAEVERLKAEAAGTDYHPDVGSQPGQVQLAIFTQRHSQRLFMQENYREKIASLQGALSKAIGDVQAFSSRLQVANTVEGKRRELQQLGVGSQLNLLAATDSRLDIQRGLQEAQQSARSAAGDLQAMKAEAAAYENDWKAKVSQDLTDASRKLDEAQGNLTKANLRSNLVELRAPQDATVLTRAKVSNGSVLQSGDQFLTLVPLNAPLEIDAVVAGSEAGYVHVGNEVTIKFDTFPFVQYGGAKGHVTVVSPDSFTQSDQGGSGGGAGGSQNQTQTQPSSQGNTSYYRVKISIDSDNLHDTPRGFHISPGMPVSADVMVGKRTVLSYIFSRALPVAMDGMREP
jgi:HlyD family secretion protein